MPSNRSFTEILAELDQRLTDVVRASELKDILDTIAAKLKEFPAVIDQKADETARRIVRETKDMARDEVGIQVADLSASMKAGIAAEFARLQRDIAALTSRLSASEAESTKAIGEAVGTAVERLEASMKALKAAIPPEFDATELMDEIESVREAIPPRFDGGVLERQVGELADQLEAMRDAFDELKKTATPRRVGGIFGSGRISHIPMVDVFTGDGSTKTFYLTKQPRDFYTIKAWGSDFPHILTHDDGNGFTVAGKALTVDNQTDAPSEGARFVVEYYV